MGWVPETRSDLALAGLGLVVLAVVVVPYIWLRFFYVDFAKIEGIPEIPGGDLVNGHFYELGEDHATTAEKWSLQHGWPVFQVRMGQRRAVFLNSFSAAREWLVTNQASTPDRPRLYTFHGIVSATSGE